MNRWLSNVYTRGRCGTCRKKDDLVRGTCFPCRVPENRRDLVKAGVPWGTANALMQLTERAKRRARVTSEVQLLLEISHPILMTNIKVDRGFNLRIRSPKYRWLRRSGWSSAP